MEAEYAIAIISSLGAVDRVPWIGVTAPSPF